jgi:DNA adenine methylase
MCLREHPHWQRLVDRYDRPGTLFYLDPPYWGSESDYGAALFSRDQFAEMAECLARLQGLFILSSNDVPETRELFGRFHLQVVELMYSVARGTGTKASELIIRGGGGK